MGLAISLCAYGPTAEVAVQGLISALDANNYQITDHEYIHPYIHIANQGRYEILTRRLPGQFPGRELWHATLVCRNPEVTPQNC